VEPDESPWPRKGKRWSHRTGSYRDLAKADEDDRQERREIEQRQEEQRRVNAELRRVLGADDRHIGPP